MAKAADAAGGSEITPFEMPARMDEQRVRPSRARLRLPESGSRGAPAASAATGTKMPALRRSPAAMRPARPSVCKSARQKARAYRSSPPQRPNAELDIEKRGLSSRSHREYGPIRAPGAFASHDERLLSLILHLTTKLSRRRARPSLEGAREASGLRKAQGPADEPYGHLRLREQLVRSLLTRPI